MYPIELYEKVKAAPAEVDSLLWAQVALHDPEEFPDMNTATSPERRFGMVFGGCVGMVRAAFISTPSSTS